MVLLNAKLKDEHSFVTLPEFNLKNVDGNFVKSTEIVGENGLLVAFICNHCPYVKAIIKNLVEDALSLREIGINTVAINPNDTEKYKDDSFENMIKFSKENNFSFPYLINETQEVAKAFNAVCTPDFFLFTKQEGKLILSHKGRLNNFVYTKNNTEIADNFKLERELLIVASYLVGKTKSSMGCSIKWKD